MRCASAHASNDDEHGSGVSLCMGGAKSSPDDEAQSHQIPTRTVPVLNEGNLALGDFRVVNRTAMSRSGPSPEDRSLNTLRGGPGPVVSTSSRKLSSFLVAIVLPSP